MNFSFLKIRASSEYCYFGNNAFLSKYQNVKHLSNSQIPKRVGFMKPAFKLNRKAQKYIVNVQWIKSSDTKKLEKLCNSIKKDANSFNGYEIIDLVYYLSKISNKNVYLTIEPLLFHFFLKYNTSVNLNGVSIHRLLRVLTEYQDLVYREWIYSIAKIISKKHAHISMRDIQLILDDLALFYDFQIHSHIIPFYNTIINRIHELEIKRLPFLIHVIGRIGCNNKHLLNTLFTTLKENILKNELYRSDFSGLLLRGLANLKICPDKTILYQLYKPVKDNINYTNIKYISWCADGFSRLNYFQPLPLLVNQMLKMKDKISQLELNDFTSILNCIQAYILTNQYNMLAKKNNDTCKNNTFADIKELEMPYYNKGIKAEHANRSSSYSRISHKRGLYEDHPNDMQSVHFDTEKDYSISENFFGKNQSDTYQPGDKKVDYKKTNKASYLNGKIVNLMEKHEQLGHSGKHTESTFLERQYKNSIYEKENEDMEFMNKREKYEKGKTNLCPSAEECAQLCSDDYSDVTANEKSSNLRYVIGINSISHINDKAITMDELYNIYLKLENIILEKVSESIYNSTPPYRVIMFELLTRLFRFYQQPIDLIISMNTHRYDTSLLLKHTNSLSLIISNKNNRILSSSKLSFHVTKYNFLNEFFFGNTTNNHTLAETNSVNMEKTFTKMVHQNMRNDTYNNLKGEGEKIKKVDKGRKIENNFIYHKNDEEGIYLSNGKFSHLNVITPLPKILKNFLHSIFFRTPALGGRTIMLLLIALVRLNFGEREKYEYLNKIDSQILPFSKANEIYRPLTKCIIREIIRKLETFNAEELIICAICLNEIDALDLNDELFSLLIERLFNLNKNNFMSNDQIAQLGCLFHFLLDKRRNLIAKKLKFATIKRLKSFTFR
ncbi:conserved Plasmodium protein, unknown function [Plasmodium ovale]|uniref:Uncharacterized protein n=2 Tax=Plasmodium ovale TaxID=36330 RepID=A0A1A8X132_PLAOA|nr:hypothetical protein POVCU2_0045190 [Plasmodium ovale curtisi]SBS97865.1 hypothetical protein POVCU1_041620 [Plasmodium ovale curtisi]SCQ16671.1 conserved Plasmodium protein, unknown function [Plasmodium ovale]